MEENNIKNIIFHINNIDEFKYFKYYIKKYCKYKSFDIIDNIYIYIYISLNKTKIYFLFKYTNSEFRFFDFYDNINQKYVYNNIKTIYSEKNNIYINISYEILKEKFKNIINND